MKRTSLLLTVFALIGLFSFTKINFNSSQSFKKFLKKGAYVFIPSGKVTLGVVEKSVNSFYLSKGEVTNFQYGEFLSHLRKNKDTEKLKICQIDTLNWDEKMGSNSAYSSHYHKHVAYRDFPVVNISHEAAKLYCEFVSETLNQNFPGVVTNCRLPSYDEYIRAAKGDDPNRIYGWNSNEIRNKNGQVLGNFTQIGEKCVTQNSKTGAYEINLDGLSVFKNTSNDVLAPSVSYWPNQFGVYNLSGNVAEMIDEKGVAVGGAWNNPGYDVRIESKKSFEGTDCSVGFRIVMVYLTTSK